MNVAEHVRLELLAARQRGEAFGAAWQAALDALPPPTHPYAREHIDWMAALDGTRPAWRRAYLDLPPLPAERTAGALGEARRAA